MDTSQYFAGISLFLWGVGLVGSCILLGIAIGRNLKQ
jgi:hypothetical protein